MAKYKQQPRAVISRKITARQAGLHRAKIPTAGNNLPIQNDLKRHIEREFGTECRDRFWTIQEELFNELGYRDYLGALHKLAKKPTSGRHSSSESKPALIRHNCSTGPGRWVPLRRLSDPE